MQDSSSEPFASPETVEVDESSECQAKATDGNASIVNAKAGWLHGLQHWASWAAMWGMLSAVGYTLANISLRTVADADPFLVTAVKTSPTTALALPWLAYLVFCNRQLFPAKSGIAWLFMAALVGQFGGNVAFQSSLHVIGIAMAVPLMMGCLVFSSALLGQRVLGEQAGWQNLLALLFVSISIFVLTMGARAASDAVTINQTAPWGELAWAVSMACLAGCSYAVLGTAIRNAVGSGLPVPSSLLIVSATGVVVIGASAMMRMGDDIWRTPQDDFLQMLLAGIWNALAFVALTKCLKTAPLYYTNALNASQIALASIAGIVLFNEAASLQLAAGVLLTVTGLLLIRN